MRILFVAGDLSGDQHAADVAAEAKARGAEIAALGGPALKKVADLWLGDLVSESVMGFWEPIKKIPVFFHFLNRVLRPALDQFKPDMVVPTDFYGFNRFVAQTAKAAGRRVCYFVSPQVWASRPGRVQTLKKCVDRMLVIFPFEEKLYRDAGVPVTFVGHPLLDRLPLVSGEIPLKVEPTVGLLPGSRPGEIRRLLPVFLQVAERLPSGTRFVLFAAPNLSNAFYDGFLESHRLRGRFLEVVRDENHEWRRGVDVALACSGTATLENALLGLPTVVAYKTSWPTYALARSLVQVKNIAMPNILAGKILMPEFIQSRATPPLLAEAVQRLLVHPEHRRSVRAELLALRGILGGLGAAGRAAETILREAA
ncbi:MAG: lipid-A-disaccharide synthase [Elusimicrobia bacterium]|jgi:lipid-A-disaccharide synthase|nr:lipid-A-disaccharide synthase [Elusimicrobiota bacterium]